MQLNYLQYVKQPSSIHNTPSLLTGNCVLVACVLYDAIKNYKKQGFSVIYNYLEDNKKLVLRQELSLFEDKRAFVYHAKNYQNLKGIEDDLAGFCDENNQVIVVLSDFQVAHKKQKCVQAFSKCGVLLTAYSLRKEEMAPFIQHRTRQLNLTLTVQQKHALWSVIGDELTDINNLLLQLSYLEGNEAQQEKIIASYQTQDDIYRFLYSLFSADFSQLNVQFVFIKQTLPLSLFFFILFDQMQQIMHLNSLSSFDRLAFFKTRKIFGWRKKQLEAGLSISNEIVVHWVQCLLRTYLLVQQVNINAAWSKIWQNVSTLIIEINKCK